MGSPGSRVSLDHILSEKAGGNYDRAFQLFVNLLECSPDLFFYPKTWDVLINQPTIFCSEGAHEENIKFIVSTMGMIEKAYSQGPERSCKKFIDAFLQGAHFRLTAHSLSDLKGLMTMRADLIRKSSFVTLAQEYYFKSRVANADKPRVGIFFRQLKCDPETTSLIPFISQARKSGIEVLTFTLDREPLDQFGRQIIGYCDAVVHLTQDLSKNVSVLRAANLDILIYGNDVTAKLSMGACLSFHRVARKAIITVSTLATTASRFVDIYFGCEFHARRGAASEFTEQFIALPDPGFAFSFNQHDISTRSHSIRESLRVREDVILFVSGANRTKLHEPVLSTWAEILKRVPESQLILYPFPPHFGPEIRDVESRIRSYFLSNGVSSGRIIILPQIRNREEVKQLLRQSDIGLDSFPYPGVTTVVDAIEAGLPIVTLAGKSLRSAQAAAILSCIEMNELITFDRRDYIEMSVKLAFDTEFRTSISHRIRSLGKSKPPFLNEKSFGESATEAYFKIHSDLKTGKKAL